MANAQRTPAARGKKWSQDVTEHSHALDLEPGVFSLDSAAGIARSLKRSADRSNQRKASPFQSAMSMLNFYINRAGQKLPARRKRVLAEAKNELRRLYGKSEGKTMAKKTSTASSKGKSKVHKVMKEKKAGTLKSGSGKKVTSRKQAVAIALNEARKSGAKVPKKKKKS